MLTTREQALENLRANPLADYRKHGFGRWACVLKASGEVVGFAGLKRLDDLGEVDLGYRLLRSVWGQGLATEASRAIVQYGFERLLLERILGLVDPANVASVRVLEKLGMTHSGMIEYRGQPTAKYVLLAEGR
jgi:RimJ/RimL family protein N-acetyltransferase